MSDFEILPASALNDVEQLRDPLQSAVQNPITKEVLFDEIAAILTSVEAVRQGRDDRYYAVALGSGNCALGMMGLQLPSAAMHEYTASSNPAEVINAYVHTSARGSGLGRALLTHVESAARARGHTEVIVNSGPRYRFSGWPFWRRVYGEPSAVAADYYGPGFDAMVWRKSLDD